MKQAAACLLSGILLAAMAAPAPAQEKESQESLKAKHDELVGEAWFKDGGWTEDWDKAREEAKKSGKLLLAYFTHSYAP